MILNLKLRNIIIAAVAGFFFFSGWWLLFDCIVQQVNIFNENKIYYLPGILTSATGLLLNLIPMGVLKRNLFFEERTCCMQSTSLARLILFFCAMILFGSVISATYILINDFGLNPNKPQWPGYGIFIQNLSIFTAALLMRFGLKNDDFF